MGCNEAACSHIALLKEYSRRLNELHHVVVTSVFLHFGLIVVGELEIRLF